jgi:CheY-like chemotaxis protein
MEGKTKILLVDDDQDLVDILTMVLESRDYEVVSAKDASQALSQADAERPDLIVLDVMMPEATEGFHVVWDLRSRKESYFPPGEYLPVQGFVDKPVEPEILLKELERVLAISSGSR